MTDYNYHPDILLLSSQISQLEQLNEALKQQIKLNQERIEHLEDMRNDRLIELGLNEAA